MQIIEDITYSLEDVIDQIDSSFGFIYTETDDYSGYILLGDGIRLNLEFNESQRGLKSAELVFPSKSINLEKNSTNADLYASSIESSVQVVYLIKRMLGGSSYGEDN